MKAAIIAAAIALSGCGRLADERTAHNAFVNGCNEATITFSVATDGGESRFSASCKSK